MGFTLALVQMVVRNGDKRGNIDHAVNLIARAAAQGARLALLPEAVDLGWTDPSSKTEAESIPDGTPCRRLAEVATRCGIHVCAGLTERRGGQVFNSAVLIDADGKVRLVHRKINELPFAQSLYDCGNKLGTVRTELGRIGLMICADAMAEDLVLGRSLGHMRAEIILSPCSWAVKKTYGNSCSYGDNWRDVYSSVATEFGTWIAAVSNVGRIGSGPWAGRWCIGASMAVGPTGEEVARAPFGVDAETILYVDVEPHMHRTPGPHWDQRWYAEEQVSECGQTGEVEQAGHGNNGS